MKLETVRYLGRMWYVCPVRGCTCIMRENPAWLLARSPACATHACADFDCWGRAWIVDGHVERVRTDPPHGRAIARRALRTAEG